MNEVTGLAGFVSNRTHRPSCNWQSLAVAALICAGLPLVLAEAAQATSPEALVTIHGTLAQGSSLGAGFYITKDGFIVTCYHVVQGARNIEVVDSQNNRFSSRSGQVAVEVLAPDYDLAILRTTGQQPRQVIELH